MSAKLLDVRKLETFYGASQALFGVSLSVSEGEVITLIGRNGMGKSTTVNTLMGLLAPRAGEVLLAGATVHGKPAYRIAQSGLALVPEGRQIFPNLTVRENLVATAGNRRGAREPWTLERVYRMFPRLEERSRNLGANLCGGEEQMLAIGRALLTNPRLLILDEATEGLAPLIRAEIWRCLSRLKAAGQSILVIDKNVEALIRIADRHYLIERGKVLWVGSSQELAAAPPIQHRYLGV